MALADDAIALGLPVFACRADKRPCTPHGFKDATLDHREIRSQFAHPDAAAIGVPTGSITGAIVVDVDVKAGARGLEWLEANRHRLPRTRTHRTGSGGFHLLFLPPRGDIVIGNTASRIAPGVDTRGNGGYIIAPPSPGYTVIDDSSLAEMPDWLVAACLPPRPEPRERPQRPDHRDSAGNTAYGLRALSDECDAVMGAAPGTQEVTLNAAALKIGGLVKGGELMRGFAFSALVSAADGMANAGRPWTKREIEEKVRRGFDDATPRSAPERPQAERKYQDEQREDDERPSQESPEPEKEQKASGARILPLTWFADAQTNLDARDFVEGVLTEGGMSVVYGESNSGKTFFVSDIALHVAMGRSWNGREVDQGGVIYLALEGGFGITNRIAAFRQHHGLEDAVLPFAYASVPINLLDPDADRATVIATCLAAQERIGMQVRLVVVDTLSRAMAGGNENAPDDMGALVASGDAIRAATGAHLCWIHHSGKNAAMGARGHSSLRAATDTEIEIVNDNGSRSAKATKQRDLECSGEWAFSLKTVELGTNRRGKPVTSCVVDVDADAPGGASRKPRLSGQKQRALEVLADLIAGSGQSGHAGTPSGFLSVPDKWWRERFYEKAMPGADTEARQKAFRRAADDLVNLGAVGMSAGRVWIIWGAE